MADNDYRGTKVIDMGIVVQESLIERARQLTGLKTKSAVVEEALRVLILLHEQEKVRTEVEQRAWSEIFHDSATPFVEQLIQDNQELFEELAQR